LHASINKDDFRISIPVIIAIDFIIPVVFTTNAHIYPATIGAILNFFFYHHFLDFLQI